jgi:hypothetical protein
VKYANLLSVQLDRFKVKCQNPYSANFRCPLCGDSQKSKTKARGNIYTGGNSLYFKCFNCSVSTTLGGLLKQLNKSLHDQYVMERYKEGLEQGPSPVKPKHEFKFSAPVFEEKNILDRIFDNIDSLPDDHPAVQYCVKRLLPNERLKKLYYLDNVSQIEKFNPKYAERLSNIDPRIVIPFYDQNKTLVAISCRALDPAATLKYITIKLVADAALIYNIENIDYSEKIYCVEGPFDSMFLPNAIAAGGADLAKVEDILPRDKLVFIFDNQPKNTAIINLMYKSQQKRFSLCIWPDNLPGKDINDLIISGMSSDEIISIIDKNTFKDLALLLKLNEWKKC